MIYPLASLSLQTQSFSLLFSLVVLAMTGVICWLGYQRNKRPLTGFLESIRFFIILLILFLLTQPEWINRRPLNESPQITFLWDNSDSMLTQDIANGTGELITRQTAAAEIIASDFLTPLEYKNKLKVEPFSTPEKTESGTSSPLSGTNIGEALESTLLNAQNLRSVIILSDGDNNQGKNLTEIALKFRQKNIPLYTIPLGTPTRLPDVSLDSVHPPLYAIVGESVRIPFTINNSLDTPVNTTLTLRSSSGKIATQDIKIPAHSNATESILWKVPMEGQDKLSLSFPPIPGERATNNNSYPFTLTGKPESIKVLVLESEPRWEYRFIRNALMRDPGVVVHTYLTHPTLKEKGKGVGYLEQFPNKLTELSQYDVIFIGDIGLGENGITEEQAKLLKGLVENQASGIVFLPGRKGNQHSLIKSSLGNLMPVVMSETPKGGIISTTPSPLILSPEGRNSLLTLLSDSPEKNADIWHSLPGFYWHAAIERAKPGSTILATHESERNRFGKIPLLITKRVGAGKVLFMGTDGAWRWRRGVEDLYHYRFWGQVARWMAYQRNMAAGEHIRLFANPERPKLHDTVLLTATVADSLGAPLRADHIIAEVSTPEEKSHFTIELTPENEIWGVYTGKLPITQTGEWKITVSNKTDSAPSNDSATLTLITENTSIEKIGHEARPEVLKELSEITQGRHISLQDIATLPQELSLLPEPKPQENRTLLWSHGLVGGFLILLLALFWILRKLNGTI